MITRIVAGVAIAALAALLIYAHGRARYQAGMMAERAKWSAQMAAFEKQAAAIVAAHIEEVRAKERAHALATERANNALIADVAAWRAAVERLRAEARSVEAGSDVPGVPGASELADGPGGNTVVSIEDVRICGENTIKAAAWPAWYKEVSK